MNSANSPVARLQEEVSVLGEFVNILHREQQALVAANAEVLLPLTTEKNTAANRLAGLANQRSLALAACGLPANGIGMSQWLKKHPIKEATSLWAEFLTLAQEARTINELNGKLIQDRMSHNQKALIALTAASENAAIYGPDGQTRFTPGSGRSLGSA
jgi:flagella synthesis protein FlgN